jgi:phage shock protein E
MSKKIIIAVLFVVAVLFQQGYLGNLLGLFAPTDEVTASIQQGSAILVDVRELDEIKEGTVKDSLWIPLSYLSAGTNLSQLNLDRSKQYLLYCRTGNRSSRAQKILESLGYSVKNAGSFRHLSSSGLEVAYPKEPKILDKLN